MMQLNNIQTQLNYQEDKKMIDPSEYEFAETLKANDIKKDIETTVKAVKLISTRYGDKRVMIIDDDKQVFLNSLSLKELVTAYGEDENNWKGKPVIITTESSERTQGKKSIVVKASEKVE